MYKKNIYVYMCIYLHIYMYKYIYICIYIYPGLKPMDDAWLDSAIATLKESPDFYKSMVKGNYFYIVYINIHILRIFRCICIYT
jgi:hypothetical protein